MRTWGWACLAAIGCTGASPGDGDKAPADSGGSPDDSETGVHTDPEPTPCASDFAGTVERAGLPFEGASLRFCRGLLCRFGTTDAQGRYAFPEVPPEWHSFEIVAGPGLATALLPLSFDCATDREVDVAVLPLDPESPLAATPAEYPVGTGLYLTVGSADLEPPLFGDPPTAVAGVRVPEESWIPFDGIQGTVLAMWYLAPFDYHAVPVDGLPIRIANEWKLADGTVLEVYVGSYSDSQWLLAGTATAQGPDLVGAALPLLSTVILVQPPG